MCFDNIRFSFTNILTGLGTDGTLQGNEEALIFDNQELKLGTLRHGVNNPNDDTAEQNRTNIDFHSTSSKSLGGWLTSRKDASFLQQAAGAYPTTITVDGAVYSGDKRKFVTGLNTVTAPTTNRKLYSGSTLTDEGQSASDTFTVDLLDDALVQITHATPTFEVFDDGSILCICSPQQLLDAQRDSSGKIQLLRDVLRPITEGTGKTTLPSINDLMKLKPDAVYRNVKIYANTRVALGVHSGTGASVVTTRRAVLLGKNACVYGSSYGTVTKGKTPFRMETQLTDYKEYKGIAIKSLDGLKKLVYNGEDFSTFVISTYSAI